MVLSDERPDSAQALLSSPDPAQPGALLAACVVVSGMVDLDALSEGRPLSRHLQEVRR